MSSAEIPSKFQTGFPVACLVKSQSARSWSSLSSRNVHENRSSPEDIEMAKLTPQADMNAVLVLSRIIEPRSKRSKATWREEIREEIRKEALAKEGKLSESPSERNSTPSSGPSESSSHNISRLVVT